MNKLFYKLLPDGWIVAYASKGSADGEPGFLQPVVKSLEKDLAAQEDEGEGLAELAKVVSVLPLRDAKTLSPKVIEYYPKDGNGKKVNIPVYGLLNMIGDNADHDDAKEWCMNLVQLFNSRFSNPDPSKDFKIYFGGNGVRPENSDHPSLDTIFSPEDVANLAHSYYKEAVMSGSFFDDDSLVKKYFLHTHDVKALFCRLRLI